MKFLVNQNEIIVCISNDIHLNDAGLYECDNMLFCEPTLSMYENTAIPGWVITGDKYIDGKFIHIDPPAPPMPDPNPEQV